MQPSFKPPFCIANTFNIQMSSLCYISHFLFVFGMLLKTTNAMQNVISFVILISFFDGITRNDWEKGRESIIQFKSINSISYRTFLCACVMCVYVIFLFNSIHFLGFHISKGIERRTHGRYVIHSIIDLSQ